MSYSHYPSEVPREPMDASYDGSEGDYVRIPGSPHILEEVYRGRVEELRQAFEDAQHAKADEAAPGSEAIVRAVHEVYRSVEQVRSEAALADRYGDDGAVLGALHERRWVAGPLTMDVATRDGRNIRLVTWFDSLNGSAGAVYAQDDQNEVRIPGELETTLAQNLMQVQMMRLFEGKPHGLVTENLLVDGQPDTLYVKKAPVAITYTPPTQFPTHDSAAEAEETDGQGSYQQPKALSF